MTLNVASQKTPVHLEKQKEEIIVEMLDEEDRISNLQAAIYTHQQASMKARAHQHAVVRETGQSCSTGSS
jgi:hypothetical protein